MASTIWSISSLVMKPSPSMSYRLNAPTIRKICCWLKKKKNKNTNKTNKTNIQAFRRGCREMWLTRRRWTLWSWSCHPGEVGVNGEQISLRVCFLSLFIFFTIYEVFFFLAFFLSFFYQSSSSSSSSFFLSFQILSLSCRCNSLCFDQTLRTHTTQICLGRRGERTACRSSEIPVVENIYGKK